MKVLSTLGIVLVLASGAGAAGAFEESAETRAVVARASEMRLSARWLLLQQVAIHIRGRLTADGRPLAGEAIRLSASSGRARPRVIRTVRSAADGSFGLHLRLVPATEWRRPAVRRGFEARFRFIIASYAGTAGVRPVRARVAVVVPTR